MRILEVMLKIPPEIYSFLLFSMLSESAVTTLKGLSKSSSSLSTAASSSSFPVLENHDSSSKASLILTLSIGFAFNTRTSARFSCPLMDVGVAKTCNKLATISSNPSPFPIMINASSVINEFSTTFC